jgi:GntR family transcriptional regulator/MocR family aminotransferase
LKRACKSSLPRIRLSRGGRVPLFEQVYHAVRAAIRGGTLPVGFRIPSTRALAQTLKVSRNTIFAAYEMLAGEGLITGKVGSGSRVARPAPVPRRQFDMRAVLRQAHFPEEVRRFRDPEGNPLYLHGRD